MNLDQHILESIGWTLIHSLWQGGVIFALLYLVSRNVNVNAAPSRYAAGIISLVLVVVSSLTTFLVVYTPALQNNVIASVMIPDNALFLKDVSSIRTTAFYSIVSSGLAWLDINLIWVIRLWLIGSIGGLLKMAAGMLYISYLRSQAQPVYANWEERVINLANSLNIKRVVSIAEGSVSSPLVIGYLKPLILFPVGMIAGLAPGQVEAILIHELAHVRRHDFIVNVFQCVLESLLFFNPFVWMISKRVRAEREYCCDDIVVRQGVEPIVYVRALAAVEGAYASGTLAMGFLGQKNQLLNRIKRVMEKTVKKDVSGAKLLPLSLVVIGLVCASWLSVGVESKPAKARESASGITADTIIVNDEKDGQSAASPDSYRYYASPFARPFVPAVEDAPDPLLFPMIPSPGVFMGDSIPGFIYTPGGDWEKFEREFTMKFREEFGDFFNKNKDQIEKMMEELRKQHGEAAFTYHYFDDLTDEERKALEEEMALINPAMEHLRDFSIPEMSADVMRMQEQAQAMAQEALSNQDWAIHQEGIARIQEDFMKDHELFAIGQQERLRAYEEEMIEQLVKDGYLDKGEKAKDLHIRNGEVTINGKKVKKSDEDKYKVIIDRYNSMPRTPHRPE